MKLQVEVLILTFILLFCNYKENEEHTKIIEKDTINNSEREEVYTNNTYKTNEDNIDKKKQNNKEIVINSKAITTDELTEEKIPQEYKQILDEYKSAMIIKFEDVHERNFPNVNSNLMFDNRMNRIDIFYVLYDIDGNGIDELLIGENGWSRGSFAIREVYSSNGKSAVKLFDGLTIRCYITIYSNGIIYVYYTSSAFSGEASFYKLNSKNEEMNYSGHFRMLSSNMYFDMLDTFTDPDLKVWMDGCIRQSIIKEKL